MIEHLKPWKSKIYSVVSALIIAYAFSPIINLLMIAFEGHMGEFTPDLSFFIAIMTVIFSVALLWKLRNPRGLHDLERSIFFAAWLFLIPTPGVMIVGLLQSDANFGGALIFAGLIFGGYYLIQSIIFFLLGSVLRRYTREQKRLVT